MTFATNDRNAGLGYPVPVLSPTQSDKTIAFDLAPKGCPTDAGRFGKAWFHICDIDIHASDASPTKTPLRCVGFGIHSDYAWIGTDVFHGGVSKPVNFTYNGATKLQMTADGVKAIAPVAFGTDSLSAGVGNTQTGVSITPLGDLRVSRHNAPVVFNRNLDGTIIQLRHAGNLVGEIIVDEEGVTLSGFKQLDDLAARVAALEANLG